MALSVSAAILSAGIGVSSVLGAAPAAPAGPMVASDAPLIAPVAFSTDRWDFRCDRWHRWDDRCFRHDDWDSRDGWHHGEGWRR